MKTGGSIATTPGPTPTAPGRGCSEREWDTSSIEDRDRGTRMLKEMRAHLRRESGTWRSASAAARALTVGAGAAGVITLIASSHALADQATLSPVVNPAERVLQFDWPALRIGTGEYEEGPTGVTVFY